MPTEAVLQDLIIDYNHHVADIQTRVSEKGEERYRTLINFMKQNNLPCDWQTITNYMRYDIRLERNLNTYIGVLENALRSFLSKYQEKNTSKINKLEFNDLLHRYYVVRKEKNIDEHENIDAELIHQEQKSINALRNQASHHKTIISCGNYEGKRLEEILTIFIKILPSSRKQSYIDEITKCKENYKEESWHIDKLWHIDYDKSEQKFIIVPATSLSIS